MNILFLDQFRTMGGGQRSLLELLPAIRARGWKARVVLPGDGSYSEKLRSGGFPVDFVRCGDYTPARKGLADFVRYCRESLPMLRGILDLTASGRTDLLYVNGPRLLPATALTALVRSIPLVFHSHHRLVQPAAVRVAGEALRWSRASLIACCRFAAEPLAPYVAEERRRILYNGVSEPTWLGRRRHPSESWNIGVMGRVEPEKGQLQFVEAARTLVAEFPASRFSVIGAPLFSGPGYLEEVKAASRGLPIEFLGWQEDIGAAFSTLDVLVVPSSDSDSTPRVVLEAFAAGIPVVAFPSGGIPELVQDGETGFLAAARSATALAARIRSVLMMDPRAAKAVANRARAAWSQRYTLERYQQEVIDAIEQSFLGMSVRNSSAATVARAADAISTEG
ncbi:MAG TPA: glycosyltransferase family 4 protein [Bryobacteraceae bacterium]|nr:glycosyltransferase family 4 protein [Bryobacteraceae bacterium]